MSSPSSKQPVSSAVARRAGQASGKKTGLRQPSNDNQVHDKLKGVSEDSRGTKVHDHLRDKRGKGVAGEYDDSINHDADQRYTLDDASGKKN